MLTTGYKPKRKAKEGTALIRGAVGIDTTEGHKATVDERLVKSPSRTRIPYMERRTHADR